MAKKIYTNIINNDLFKVGPNSMLGGDITSVTKVEVRKNPVPIDAFSIFPSVQAAEDYAKNNDVAYPGQYIAVVDITHTPYSVKPYVVGVLNAGTENEEGCLVEIPTGTISVSATTITLITNPADDTDTNLYIQHADPEHQYGPEDIFTPQSGQSITEPGTYLALSVGGSTVYIAVDDLINFDNYVTKQEFNTSIANINSSITSINNRLNGGFDTQFSDQLDISAGQYISMSPNVSSGSSSNSLGTLQYNIAVAQSSLLDSNEQVIFANTSLATDGYVKEQLAWHCIEGVNDEPEPEPEP